MERHNLEEGKKNSARLGAYLIFIDESGFMLTPTVHRTWSPVGQTPLLRHRHRNDRLSFVSGLSVSPRRYHLGLYGEFFLDNSSTHRGIMIKVALERQGHHGIFQASQPPRFGPHVSVRRLRDMRFLGPIIGGVHFVLHAE